MESKFQKTGFTCLNGVLREVRNTEQTQEIRLSDGMPDIGRILGAWGQVILRGKEWNRDSIQLSAGMQTWVLYQPEDGGKVQRLEGWIPFQMSWDLPDNTPEGHIRILCLPRFVDARSTSARKMTVRAGVGAMAEVLAPVTAEVYIPDSLPEDVELLRTSYPMCLPKEAGEKTFLMDEELILPGSAPLPEKIIYYRMEPIVTDQKVLGNKLVFRGNGRLHVLYESEEGQLHNWDFEVPFSQYMDLEGSHSPDARGDVLAGVTSLELELDDEGHMTLKAGLVAQYLICDMQLVELVEDAYSPLRELGVRQEMLELPAVLDSRRENIYGEQTISADGNLVADVEYLRDFPRYQRSDSGMEVSLPGSLQTLYYDGEGKLQSVRHRWEQNHMLKADPDSRISAIPMAGGEPQLHLSGDRMTVKVELPVQFLTTGGRGIPMVTGLELGELRERDPERPSLILRRAGRERLWDVAKRTGSTVEAIQKANGLQEEPTPDRMLLIPVS